jgi:hypothetical protein
MNNDPHNSSDDSFDELLRATLAEYATDQPRPGLDRRILASLPPHRTPIRWPLWASLATALAVAIVTISLHLHHPSPTTRVPHDYAAQSVASGNVIVGTLPAASVPHPHVKSRTPAVAIPPAPAQTDASIQTPPTAAPDSDVAIEPIHISALSIPPLPGADSSPQPIAPIRIDPIRVAAIQIPSIEIEPPNSNY